MTVSRRFALMSFLAALLMTQLSSPLVGTVLSLDPPVPVASPGCLETSADVAVLPGGGFVSVWQGGSDPTGAGQIQARLYGPADNPLGSSFRVSSGQGIQPAVAVRPDGRFLVAWRDRFGSGVRARLFEPTGAPAAAETRVDGFGAESTGMDAAALPDGRFAVTWNGQASVNLALIDADGQSRLPSFEVEALAGFTGVDPRIESPAVAVQPDGDIVVVWTVRNASTGLELWDIDGMILPSATSSEDVRRLSFETGGNTGKIMEAAVGADGAGNIVVAWKEDARGPAPNRIAVQLLDPLGQPRRAAFRVDDNALWELVGAPALAVTPGGSFAVAWGARISPENLSPPFPRSQVYTRVFDGAGNALGLTRTIAPTDAAGLDGHAPALAWVEGREFVVAWQEVFPDFPPAGCFSEGIVARRIFTGCLPGSGRLCLGDGRFELTAAWNAPNLGTGTGKAVALTRDTGYFWFFGPDNVELVVKVLDGRTVNNHFWVFYGSLSDVAWTLKVEDLLTGGERLYANPQGQLASRGDTQALAASSAGSAREGVVVEAFDAVRLDREALPAGPAGAVPAPVMAAAPAGATVLTLNDGFQVDVTWSDPFNGGSGAGQGVPLTDDSGYFWFFDPSNVELAVKVLDGRAVNGKYWVFYGALTNVEYDLRVRFKGQEKVYHNPPFRFLSRADSAAFDGN